MENQCKMLFFEFIDNLRKKMKEVREEKKKKNKKKKEEEKGVIQIDII